jgi:hypothetical protein
VAQSTSHESAAHTDDINAFLVAATIAGTAAAGTWGTDGQRVPDVKGCGVVTRRYLRKSNV